MTKAEVLAIVTNKKLNLTQRFNALVECLLGVGSFNEYEALLTQSSTDAPTANVLKNDLGGTIVFAYSSTGTYTATLNGAFVDNQTSIDIVNSTDSDAETEVSAVRTNANVITIKTSTAGTLGNGILNDTKFTIRVPRQS